MARMTRMALFILDPSKVEALAALQCTLDEIASGLGVSVSTLERRRKENSELDDAIKKGRKLGKRSIRRLQYKNDNGKGQGREPP